MSSPENEFTYSTWVKRGHMLIQRIYLDYDDPESVWMLWWERFREVIPMHICDQIWGADAVTQEEHDRIKQMLQRHEENLLIEAGCIFID